MHRCRALTLALVMTSAVLKHKIDSSHAISSDHGQSSRLYFKFSRLILCVMWWWSLSVRYWSPIWRWWSSYYRWWSPNHRWGSRAPAGSGPI